MGLALLGKKVGMTRVFTDEGVSVPVTAIEVGPCVVTQVKSPDGPDRYGAVQIAFEDMKPRNSTMPMIGHDGKVGATPKRHHREFRVDADELERFEPGQTLSADSLADEMFVDVIGTSKGKGFQGAMKRHNFKGQPASHGTERKHRSPGSIASHSSNAGTGRLKRGLRMPGQMGSARVTVRSLEIVRIDQEQNLILVKGPVPGPDRGVVEVRTPRRLHKSKARKRSEASS